MKNSGALRKVMLILLLSILGSYCIGSDAKNSESNYFDATLHSAYGMVASVSSYCHKLYSELAHQIMGVFKKNEQQDVKIQNRTGEVTSAFSYCTDGKKDCEFNEKFFDDTYNYTGASNFDQSLDLPIDPKTV